MMGLARGIAAAALVCLVATTEASAAKSTPIEWRQRVDRHARREFIGQFKHLGWVRDQNPQNFIDDLIDAGHYGIHDSVDIVVELNRRSSPDSLIRWLSSFGQVTHAGALVSCAYLRRVPFGLLDSLAANPSVAMIELQVPLRPALDVATRGTGAVASSVAYTSKTAAHNVPLSGANIAVAVIDFGVWDRHDALAPAFIAGFDATLWPFTTVSGPTPRCMNCSACLTPTIEEGDGCTNPEPVPGESHATNMAGLAVGRPVAGANCREPATELASNDCGGMAPAATLVDVKVCDAACSFADPGPVMRGIDWVAYNAPSYGIRVASISLFDGAPDDGTSALCKALDRLADTGVVPVVCLGNSGSTSTHPNIVSSPGAASSAITVTAYNDNGQVLRTAATTYEKYLVGPRPDPATLPNDPLSKKPDLAAPGQGVYTAQIAQGTSTRTDTYFHFSGSSVATAIVAGGAALILQAEPDLDALCLKNLLQTTADKAKLLAGVDWDPIYGKGLLDLAEAASKLHQQDIRFAHCQQSAAAGAACPLTTTNPPWLNLDDIKTSTPPQAGIETTILADVVNDGPPAKALITFAIRNFGAGDRGFTIVGEKEELLPTGPKIVDAKWTPQTGEHQCIQVTIHYGSDTDFGNNLTQRNIHVAASTYAMEVENPFFAPASFRVAPKSRTPGWHCTVDDSAFAIGASDGPRTLSVSFRAPAGAPRGALGDCDVAVYARVDHSREETLIGGVTVETFVPFDCRLIGQVVDVRGRPVPRARVRLVRRVPDGLLRAPWEKSRVAVTDRDGVFDLRVPGGADLTLELTLGRKRFGTLPIQVPCGVGTLRIEVGDSGIRLLR